MDVDQLNPEGELLEMRLVFAEAISIIQRTWREIGVRISDEYALELGRAIVKHGEHRCTIMAAIKDRLMHPMVEDCEPMIEIVGFSYPLSPKLDDRIVYRFYRR